MKLFRDTTHSIITFNHKHHGKPQLAVTIMAMFSFSKPGEFLSDADFWRIAKKNFNFDQGERLDLNMPKKRGEFFVKGACYAYDDHTSQSTVEVTLGNMDKKIVVFGDRQWTRDALKYKVGKPDYFSRIPITLENAFGGNEHPVNPAGKGFRQTKDSMDTLPNIELPYNLIHQNIDTPQPALLLPHSSTAPVQVARFGTIDEDWLRNESPYYPADIDSLYFNLAEDDQQSEGYFRGDEKLSCSNMHPEKPLVKGQLPAMRVRCFYKRTSKDLVDELMVNLDTVWLLPEEEKGILVWHGLIQTQDIAANDIEYIYSVNERLNEGKDLVYHLQRMNKRPEKSLDKLLNKPNIPVKKPPSTIAAEFKSLADLIQSRQNKNTAPLAAPNPFQGQTPADTLLALSPGNDKLPAINKDQWKGRLLGPELIPAGASQQSKTQSSLQQLQFLKSKISNSTLGDADKTMAMDSFDQLTLKIEQLDKASRLSQFRLGLFEKSTYTRDDIIEGHQQKKDFSNENLAGIDLSELNLSGINLSGCNLSGCNLKRTCLSHANLSTAILNHADLSEAVIIDANMAHVFIKNCNIDQTCFKESKMHYAKFENCQGKSVNFSKAFLNYAVFKKCHFSHGLLVGLKANFLNISESHFDACDFRDARMQFGSFHKNNWQAIEFTGSDLSYSIFHDSKLSQINATKVLAPKLSLTNCSIDKLSLADSHLNSLSCKGSILKYSTFTKSSLININFKKANLSHCEFKQSDVSRLRSNDQTRLTDCLFEQCTVIRAVFLEGIYEEIQFNNCDLLSTQLINSSWKKVAINKCSAKKFLMINCKMNFAVYKNVNFYQGIFKDTVFKDAEFNHCNLYSILFDDHQKADLKIIDCLQREIALIKDETV